MDTKLKNYNGLKIVNIIAFILCIATFLGSIYSVGFIYRSANQGVYGQNIDDLMFCKSFKESSELQQNFDNNLSEILYLLNNYKSENYILNGGTVLEEELEGLILSEMYDQGYEYVDDISESEALLRFVSENPDISEAKQKEIILNHLREFDARKKDLAEQEGFSYYVSDGNYVITNLGSENAKVEVASTTALEIATTAVNTEISKVTAETFKKNPVYLIYDNDKMTKEPSFESNSLNRAPDYDHYLEEQLYQQYNPDLKLYFSYDKSYMDKQEVAFNAAKESLLKSLPLTIILALISFILLLYLIIVSGKKDKDGNRDSLKIDGIFTEIKLFIVAFALIVGGGFFLRFLFDTVNYGISIGDSIYVNSDPFVVSLVLSLIIGVLSAVFGLIFILSIVRSIKAGIFVKNSLTYIIFSKVWGSLKSIYYGGSLMRKVVIATLLICLISATAFLAPIVAGLIIIIAPKYVNKFNEIKKGVDEVKNGNLAYKIEVKGEGELDELARGINQISEASNIAIQNELKNQRLKTDLISNVSHDLKTPLTSIITYIDLLKREGLTSENAEKYLEILDQKSIRLKTLTEDLFDAAKASSGAIPVKFERVEILSLINQGLGEMSDRVAASNLEFKINAAKEKYYVKADGQLLWRVVENLFSNIFKYAQEGSRVYIDIKEHQNFKGGETYVVLELKNISKTELNIDSEELMERFKRGDESRTTEGSGLGLAIAKDLVKLQDGQFEIRIDGDLFKAIVTLASYTE